MGDCECRTWGRCGAASELILKHHPECEHYRPEPEIRQLLSDLIDGIESWASDEDGVHSDCWSAYVAACNAVGEYSRPSTTEPV